MDVELRAAELADAEQIQSLLVGTWKTAYTDIFDRQVLEQELSDPGKFYPLEQVHEQIADDSRHFIVAVDERDIVGMAQAIHELDGTGVPDAGETEVWIMKMYVRQDQQGNGIGTRLFEEAMDWSRERFSDGVFRLEVFAQNTAAVRLYQRYGFEIIRERDVEVFGREKATVVMERDF